MPTYYFSCGFLASVAGIPPSFHQECFLSSLLRVCLEKETNVLQEKSFFDAQLLLYYYVCVRFISSLKDYRYCVFPLIASCFNNLESKSSGLPKAIEPVQKCGAPGCSPVLSQHFSLCSVL